MKTFEHEGCGYEILVRPHNSEICGGGVCVRCNDGNWENLERRASGEQSGILWEDLQEV